MNTNMMELNMNETELVNGGIEWGKIFKEAAWGVGIGAACGAGVGALKDLQGSCLGRRDRCCVRSRRRSFLRPGGPGHRRRGRRSGCRCCQHGGSRDRLQMMAYHEPEIN